MRITIDTGNDAFQHGNKGHELALILRRLADQLEEGRKTPIPLFDTNGNKVGEATGS